MEGRGLAVSLARGRIAIGAVSLLVPGFVGRTMTGRDGSGGETRLFVRMVGARDLALGLGLLVALDRSAPVRGWLEASAVVDGIDAAAVLSRVATSAQLCFQVPSAWRPPERCSARGWHGGSTRRRLHCQDSRGDKGRPSAALLPHAPLPHSLGALSIGVHECRFPLKGGVCAPVPLTSATDEKQERRHRLPAARAPHDV